MLDDSRLDNPAPAREERRNSERPGDRELAEVAAWVETARGALQPALDTCPDHWMTEAAGDVIADAIGALGVVAVRLDREGWPV